MFWFLAALICICIAGIGVMSLLKNTNGISYWDNFISILKLYYYKFQGWYMERFNLITREGNVFHANFKRPEEN